tara:strand:+ start:2306 stop:2593 length:288 start_codon:yes stop_codon:yes gene_type:complete
MYDLREVIARGFMEAMNQSPLTDEEWAGITANQEDRYTTLGWADAALAAIKQAGFVVVPAEPTPDQIEAGYTAMRHGSSPTTMYRAMIEASNAPT